MHFGLNGCGWKVMRDY